MNLVLAIDQAFEPIAAVCIASFLIHTRFDSLILVTPTNFNLTRIAFIAESYNTTLVHRPIPSDSVIYKLPVELQPYFYCIEALNQPSSGRYLYVDADTLCVSDLVALKQLSLDIYTPFAACSHGRPMPDRSLILNLKTPYHYFNAGVFLFDSELIRSFVTPDAVIHFYLLNSALCRFREQCALNALLHDRVKFLPGQYTLLNWMRKRQTGTRWHNLTVNSMAYCLEDVRDNMKIIHLSAGSLPYNIESSRHEQMDLYWLLVQSSLSRPSAIPRYSDLW